MHTIALCKYGCLSDEKLLHIKIIHLGILVVVLGGVIVIVLATEPK
jgi:hypothetical protein